MKNLQLLALTMAGVLLVLTKAHAQGPVTVTECPKNHELAVVDVSVELATNFLGCPLLQVEELRELAALHFHGATFAGLPGTCLSGQIQEGSTITVEGEEVAVTGTTESAQRLMPEAAALNLSPFPPEDPTAALFIQGLFFNSSGGPYPFISGAAATVVSLASDDKKLDGLRLVLEDRFTVNFSNGLGVDTEDFSVIGADRASVTGRLFGSGVTDGVGGFPAPLSIEGSFCIKYVVPTLK